MHLKEQAWDLMLQGHSSHEVATIMDRTIQQIRVYLWNEKRHLGLTEYPFSHGTYRHQEPALQTQIWCLAEDKKDKRQIMKILHLTLRQVTGGLSREKRRLGFTEFPFHVKSEVKRRRQKLGNIYHPEVKV